MTELQATLQLPVRTAKRALAGSFEILTGIHDIDSALLEFHRIGTSGNRCRNQLAGVIKIAVVVYPDLGNDEARFFRANSSICDLHRIPHQLPPGFHH